MDKQEIFDAFDGKIAMRAIQKDNPVEGQWRIYGKQVEVEYMGDGLWDVFVCNRQDMTKEVSMIRVNRILGFFSAQGMGITALTGEGHTQGTLEQIKPVILSQLRYLGIPKKRQLSDEQLDALRKRMKGFNRGQI